MEKLTVQEIRNEVKARLDNMTTTIEAQLDINPHDSDITYYRGYKRALVGLLEFVGDSEEKEEKLVFNAINLDPEKTYALCGIQFNLCDGGGVRLGSVGSNDILVVKPSSSNTVFVKSVNRRLF